MCASIPMCSGNLSYTMNYTKHIYILYNWRREFQLKMIILSIHGLNRGGLKNATTEQIELVSRQKFALKSK